MARMRCELSTRPPLGLWAKKQRLKFTSKRAHQRIYIELSRISRDIFGATVGRSALV